MINASEIRNRFYSLHDIELFFFLHWLGFIGFILHLHVMSILAVFLCSMLPKMASLQSQNMSFAS